MSQENLEAEREVALRAYDPWESVRIDVTDMREAGDTLVVFVQFHGIGMGSGVELTVPFVHLGNYRNGKLLRFRAYANRAEALEAVGLRG
jgi:ketosteroid isomerase-like protein